MLSDLSDRPELETLERFLERLLETRAGDVEFVVLFGSMARGNWSRGSDYDVLVGLCVEDGKRLIERIGELESLVDGNIQVFPYDRPAWERMFESFHPCCSRPSTTASSCSIAGASPPCARRSAAGAPPAS